MPSRIQIAFVLSLGLLGISLGSILVRFSQQAPSLTIAFYRMFWASLFLLPFYLRRRPSRPVSWRVTLGAGLALALHFACWIGSLRFTSVAVSVLLLSTSPVLVALLSYAYYRERLSRLGIAGVALTVLGSGLLVYSDLSLIEDWRGPLLALLGGLAYAVYFVVGRGARQGMTLLEYVVPVYATAAALLAVMVMISGVPFSGFRLDTYVFLILLALLPQCLGHTAYNWSLKYLTATMVAVLALAEPITASALAYWILSEPLPSMVVAGGAAVATGILLVARWGSGTSEEIDTE